MPHQPRLGLVATRNLKLGMDGSRVEVAEGQVPRPCSALSQECLQGAGSEEEELRHTGTPVRDAGTT